MKKITLLSTMFLTLLLFLSVVPVYATLTGYAITYEDNYNVLYSIDLTTGAVTLIGSTGISYPDDIVEGLAIDKAGNLYAITAHHMLYNIDKTTGFASLIGDTERKGDVEGLDFFDNVLYGIDFNGFDNHNQRVFSIDTSNASTKDVVELDDSSIQGPSSLAALDSNTMLFTAFLEQGSSYLFSVDLQTGETKKIGPIKVDNNYLFIGGLDFGMDGTLYGIGGDGKVVQIDPVTAEVTVIGDTGSQLWLGLAIPGEKPSGALPVSQCISLFESETEKISMRVSNDFNGCIIEASVEFYRSSDCTGETISHSFEPPLEGFVYKSGTMGGCPEAIEVTKSSPVCVTVTLQSGRKTKVCY